MQIFGGTLEPLPQQNPHKSQAKEKILCVPLVAEVLLELP